MGIINSPFSKEVVMDKVHSDNKSGETPVEGSTPDPLDHSGVLRRYQDLSTAAKINTEIQREYNKLPGSKEQYQGINWFGGSYSGADMKVVAHLYQSNDEETARIQNDLQVARKILDGAAALVGGGITALASALDPTWSYLKKRIDFLHASGISAGDDPVDAEAGEFLVRNIFVGANWNTPLGIAKTKRRAENVKNSQFSLVTAIEGVLFDRKKLKSKGQQTVVLASLQTLSVQSHREKFAVRALGHSYVKGYTRGPRTIAGSMIFTVFNEHALAALTRSLGKSATYGEKDLFLHTLLPDQLPPIDLTIAFANEYGSLSQLRLFGVEFINDGATYSIEDLMTENIINFVARDADPMTSHGNIKLHRNQTGLADEYRDLSGSQLLFNDQHYKEYITRLGFRRRLMNR